VYLISFIPGRMESRHFPKAQTAKAMISELGAKRIAVPLIETVVSLAPFTLPKNSSPLATVRRSLGFFFDKPRNSIRCQFEMAWSRFR
jgi:hypothetical protein